MSDILTGNAANLTTFLNSAYTSVASNGGLLRVTTPAPHLFGDQDQVCLTGTVYQGIWTINVINATTFDCQGSVFLGTDTGNAQDLSLTPQIQVLTDGDTFSAQLSGLLSAYQSILDRTQFLMAQIQLAQHVGAYSNQAGYIGTGNGLGGIGVIGYGGANSAGGQFTGGETESVGVIGQGFGSLGGVVGTSTAGPGVHGTGGSGSSFGVWGTGGTPNGAGVWGNGTGTGPGVYGAGGDTNGQGVKGVGAGTGYGVWGNGSGAGSAGVYGIGTAGSAGLVGQGQGIGDGVDGYGGAGGGNGVEGTGGTGGIGVQGNAGSGGVPGVFGQGNGASSPGVQGAGQSGSAGIYGSSDSENGVWGQGGAPTGNGVYGKGGSGGNGVQGDGGSSGGYGVVGNGSGGNPGVQGTGNGGGAGVVGDGGATGNGVTGNGGGSGNAGVRGNGSALGGDGLYGAAYGDNGRGVFAIGNGSGAGGSFSSGTTGDDAIIANNGPLFVNNSGGSQPNRLYSNNICKCHGVIETNGTGGLSLKGSFNVNNVTITSGGGDDNGYAVVSFVSGMANANYTVIASAWNNSSVPTNPVSASPAWGVSSTTTGSFWIMLNADPTVAVMTVSWAVFGQQ